MILDPMSFVPVEVERRHAELRRLARPRPAGRARRRRGLLRVLGHAHA